jgi:hypothetical protein
MLPFEDRYTRQRRLPEVGPEGQLLLERQRLAIAPHADVELELDYLRRAGVEQVTVIQVGGNGLGGQQVSVGAEQSALDFPWAAHFQFGGPLGVARGAWSALARIRAALAAKRG